MTPLHSVPSDKVDAMLARTMTVLLQTAKAKTLPGRWNHVWDRMTSVVLNSALVFFVCPHSNTTCELAEMQLSLFCYKSRRANNT